MGHDPDRIQQCGKCGGDGKLLDKTKVPGGSDWYEYECKDCGHEWQT